MATATPPDLRAPERRQLLAALEELASAMEALPRGRAADAAFDRLDSAAERLLRLVRDD